jgi:hypothetical protein
MTDPETPNSASLQAMVPGIRRLAPNLVMAGILPIVAYALLRPHVHSDTVGLSAILVFPVAEIVFERVRKQRWEPVGVIAMIGISVGLIGASILHGDSLLLKVRDSALTGGFGVVCLASLGASRPALFYLGRSFATGGDRQKEAAFDRRWDLPGVAHGFRLVTVVWGIALIGEAAVRTILAVSLPTEQFLVVAQVVNWGTLAALLWFTISYDHPVGDRTEASGTDSPTAKPVTPSIGRHRGRIRAGTPKARLR